MQLSLIVIIIILFILYFAFFNSSTLETYTGNYDNLERLNTSSIRYLDDPNYIWPYYGIWDPILIGNRFFWNNGTRYPRGYYPYGAIERYYRDSYINSYGYPYYW
jgi:hypothetical protein